MSVFPDIKDVGVLAGFVMWGNPWHGTVKGGVLNTGKLDESSSEITRAWPQPPNAFIWLSEKDGQPDDAYTAPDGAAPAVQSAYDELKIAHAADGMEFKPWALISGGQVYGKQVGIDKWFYYAGDKVWLVTLDYPATVENTGSLTVQISAQAWPEFTTSPHSAAIVRSVTLENIGQAAPDLSALGISTTLSVWLRDVKPNGSACILSLHTADKVDGTVPPALGFVLVELSSVDGVFDAVAASVLKTREQTLGEVVANRNYSTFACEFIEVVPGRCLGPSHTADDGGIELTISDRLVTAFFDATSGAIVYSAVDYETTYHKQMPTEASYTVTSISGGMAYWDYKVTSSPFESIETLTYKVGAESYLITDDYSVTGSYSETVESFSMETYNLYYCGTFYCAIPPADTPYKTEAELLKIRLTAQITTSACYYPNGDGPVVLLRDHLIGTPKGITAISDVYLNAFEDGLAAQQALLYVAYHPKTGEVVPFLSSPVSFV